LHFIGWRRSAKPWEISRRRRTYVIAGERMSVNQQCNRPVKIANVVQPWLNLQLMQGSYGSVVQTPVNSSLEQCIQC